MLPVPTPLGPLGPVAALHYPYLPHCSLHAVYTDRMHHGNLMTAVHYRDGLQPGSLAHAGVRLVNDGDWGAEMTLAGTDRYRDVRETHFHVKAMLVSFHITVRVVQALMGSGKHKIQGQKRLCVHSPAKRWESVTQW